MATLHNNGPRPSSPFPKKPKPHHPLPGIYPQAPGEACNRPEPIYTKKG